MPIRYDDTSVNCNVSGKNVQQLCDANAFLDTGFSIDGKMRVNFNGNKYRLKHDLAYVPKYITAVEFWYCNSSPKATVYYRDESRFTVRL